jgi:hypothetical protein
MDPNFIGASEWSQIGQVIRFLGLVPLSAILFAFSLLIAHGLIPSMVSSHHLPRAALRLRPFFYLTSLAGVVALVVVLATLVGLVDVIESIYKDWWI